MPRIRTFRPRALDGSLMSNPVEYWPLKVIALDRPYTLAVSRGVSGFKDDSWIISDPVTGLRVCNVTEYYKGCPIGSVGMGPRAAVRAAHEAIEGLLAMKGAHRFVAAIEAAAQKFNATLQQPA